MQNSHCAITLTLLFLPMATLGAGTRSYYLTHGPSTASFGRGETGTVSQDDPAAFYYNPALAAETHGTGVALSSYPLLDGTLYHFLSFSNRFNKSRTVLSTSIIDIKSGDVEIRKTISDAPTTIQTNQWTYVVTLAAPISKKADIGIGISAKYLSYDLYDKSDDAFGVDAGIYRVYENGLRLLNIPNSLRLGFSVQNLVPPVFSFHRESEALERIHRAGLALSFPLLYRFKSHDVITACTDLIFIDGTANFAAGLEYAFMQKYFLRSGVYPEHMTIGAGVKLKGLHIDYATSFGNRDLLNKFGLSYYWDSIRGGPKTRVGRKSGASKQQERSLMDEAQRSLQEQRRIENAMRSEFNTALEAYRKRQFLTATDRFKSIVLQHPEYDNARYYLEKIAAEMQAVARHDYETDIVKGSYAKGYVHYVNQNLPDALNEWQKVQFVNNHDELIDYISAARKYLEDTERRKRELAVTREVEQLYSEGMAAFENKRWVASIKSMEKVLELCRTESFPDSLLWNNRAYDAINQAVKQLSKVSLAPPAKSKPKEQDTSDEIDIDNADRKYNEGLILYAQGKVSDAVRLWEMTLRFNPLHEKARKALAKIKEESGPGK